VVLDFAVYLVSFGQVELTQSRRGEATDTLSESFYITAAAGIVGTIVILLLAEPMAALFGTPQLASVLLVVAPCCLVTALGVTQEGVLRRDFRNRSLAYRNLISTIVGGAAAIVVMLAGFGVLALATQRLVKAIVMTGTMWLVSSWRPGLNFDFGVARSLAAHGARIASATFLTMAGPRTVDILIGLFLGTTQLGYVRVAFRFFDFVSQFIVLPFSSVALSTFSRQKHDRAAALSAFLRITQVTTAVLVPVMFGIGLLADDIVAVLLGEKWEPTVLLIRILSAIAVVAPVNYLFVPLMLSVNATAIVLRQSTLQLVAGLLFAAVAMPFGVTAVLAAHVTRSYAIFAYNISQVRAALRLKFSDFAGALAPFLVAAIVMVLVTAGLLHVLPLHGHVATIAAGAAVGGSVYLATLLGGERAGFWSGVTALTREVAEVAWAMRKRPRQPSDPETSTGEA
jgi:O-antigen/teichoic acid export membrane protein